MKICIDPGHGGLDPGAIGPTGVKEKNVALSVAKNLANILTAAGAEARLTRDDDSGPTLAHRAAVSNSFGADVFVSIHANAFTSPAAHGMEVWTSVGQTKADPVAEAVANALQAAFPGLVFRADMSDGDKDKESNFYVLYYTKAPAVLVELAFITNPIEEELLNSANYQSKVARAIAEGLAKRFGLKLPDPAPVNLVGEAIKVLKDAGIINTPDYWLACARPGKQASGEYVGMLIQKMAKKIRGKNRVWY